MIESPRYFLHLHLNPTFKNDSIFFWNSRSQIPFTNSPLGVPVRRVVTQKAPKPVLRVCSVAAFVVFYTEFWNRILWFHDQFFYSYYYCYQLLLQMPLPTTYSLPGYLLLLLLLLLLLVLGTTIPPSKLLCVYYIRIFYCILTKILSFAVSLPFTTVDGRNPKQPLGCIRLCK